MKYKKDCKVQWILHLSLIQPSIIGIFSYHWNLCINIVSYIRFHSNQTLSLKTNCHDDLSQPICVYSEFSISFISGQFLSDSWALTLCHAPSRPSEWGGWHDPGLSSGVTSCDLCKLALLDRHILGDTGLDGLWFYIIPLVLKFSDIWHSILIFENYQKVPGHE